MARRYSPHEPTWKPKERHTALPSSTLQQWLLDKSSLTKKLSEKADGRLSVNVIGQKVRQPLLSERRCLSLPARRWAVVREVLLYGEQTPWVYARTIIPLSTLKGSLRRLHYLGNRPLGKELFADPSMRREHMELAKLEGRHLPVSLRRHYRATWGRRSTFFLKGKPLLVAEIFLSNLIDESIY